MPFASFFSSPAVPVPHAQQHQPRGRQLERSPSSANKTQQQATGQAVPASAADAAAAHTTVQAINSPPTFNQDQS